MTGALELVEVQLEGRKRMPAADFANGQRLTENEDLGERTRLNLPLGYRYSATYAGIREVEKDDLALIVSGLPANAAAVFTQNRVQAAPVKLSRRNLKLSQRTGGRDSGERRQRQLRHAHGRSRWRWPPAKAAAKLLKLPPAQVLPASTGVIGVELDPRKITDALPRLVGGLHRGALRRCRARHHDHRPGAEDGIRRSANCGAARCASRA